jgi:hypothetical protein
MRRSLLSLAFATAAVFVLGGTVLAQSEFNDVNVEYTFSLPSDNWKMTVKPSRMSPNVEYVYNYRKEGHLEIRKITIDPNTLFGDLIRDEEQKLQFVPGYVAGREENFKGLLEGRVFNYEFVRSGRNMSGRFYFLRASGDTVYVLRFTGEKSNLRSIRNETDLIARTFKVK